VSSNLTHAVPPFASTPQEHSLAEGSRSKFVFHARATPERLKAFSDAIFAVLITVLVLELRPPAIPTFRALLLLWPTWLSYAVSYLFIAIVWTNHHHLMRYATEARPRLCFRSPPLGWP
jgi:uncharacterized membrane protein